MRTTHPSHAALTGTELVEASAGTGKTHTITTLFLRLVLERNLSVREIVVVTFTEAATAELRARIRQRLRQAIASFDNPSSVKDDDLRAIITNVADRAEGKRRITRAISELDLAAISTIHAFCLRALQERAFESGAVFGLELAADTSDLLREIADDYWSSWMVPMAPDLYRLVSDTLKLDLTERLVRTIARRPPDLPILPNVTPQDPEACRPALDAVYGAARATWLSQGKRACFVLLQSKLSKRAADGYTDENIERWRADLDEFFAPKKVARFSNSQALRKLSTGELAKMTLKNGTPPVHMFFGQAETLIQLADGAKTNLVLRFKLGLVEYTRRELAARKAARRIQGFEDLLFTLDKALAGEGGDQLARALRGQYSAALIDEFQDTDPVQFRIFRRIFHKVATLVAVGDPKQSVYAFRGADVFAYFQAARDAGSSTYTLDENYRSDPSLVRAVNTIFKCARKPFVFDEIAFHEVDPHEECDRIAPQRGAFEILFLPRADGETKPHTKGDVRSALPALVATEIARFLASGVRIDDAPVRAGHIAVLTRTNDQARQVQNALRALGIATALESEARVYDSPEARELELVLRAVIEPTRGSALRAALATSIVGLSADQIVTLETNEPGWQEWSERFRAIQDLWATRGFAPAFRKIIAELGSEPRLLSYVDGERRVTNLLHLRDILHGVARSERLGPSALVRWLAAKRVGAEDGGYPEDEAAELRLESDARAIKLLTIHKSKGLEYPVVYCPFLWDTSLHIDSDCLAFHDPSDGDKLKLHFAPDDAIDAIATREAHAENQRLLYVALTRAKHRCSIVWGAIRDTDDSCLAYTLHPGRDDVLKVADAEIRKDLSGLAKASKNTIVVRDLAAGVAPPYVDEERAAGELRARTYDRRVDHWWRIGSFSSMTSGASASAREAEGVDRDEVDEDAAAAAETQNAVPIILSAFPRGAKPGTLLHEILEDYDFATDDAEALPALVREKLGAFGYAPDAIAEPLVQGLRAMIDTPLGVGTSLRTVTRARRVNELEFLLPTSQAPRCQVTAKALAEAFAKHGTQKVPAAYVAQLGKLGFLPLRGFLRGFVDLVFEHDSRFYVVDYKSNHLGDVASDYAPAALTAAMSHANYFLQYHLYAAAVHRWLARRLHGYDYERSFGGVLYMFARGMSPSHAPGTGIFFDRPQRALIDALSEVLDHG